MKGGAKRKLEVLFLPGQQILLVLVSSRPGTENFSLKGQVVNILGFMGHTVHVSNTQLCRRSMQAKTWRGCVPIKLYWQNSQGARFGPSSNVLVLQNGVTSPRHPLRYNFNSSTQKKPHELFSLSRNDTKGISFIYLELIPHLPPDTAKVILQS